MITVVHIITALGAGGAERVLFLVATKSGQSRDIRHVVVSLADDGVYGAQLRAAGIEIACLDMRRGRNPLPAIWRLTRLLRRLRPDVVMTWLYHADLMGSVAARLASVRTIVWNIRCSDMDFSRYAATTRRIARALAWLSWLPWAVATNSHAGRSAHEAMGYRPKRWAYLPNGIDTELWRSDAADRAAVRGELQVEDGAFVIGVVARADPQKDHATLFAAARLVSATHPRLRLVLVGQGTQELSVPPAIAAATIALGERRDVPRLMRGLDALVLSSAFGEGFPNVLVEAMASGVPCIATDTGDARLILGDMGTIVPPRDAPALSAAMLALLEMSAQERQRMGLRARERVMAEFSLERCQRGYAEFIRAAARPRK